MSYSNRTIIPPAEWTSYNLEKLKVEITRESDMRTFFGVSELPVPQNISPVIWNNVHAPAGPLSKTEKTFFAYMEDALRTPPGEMSLVDDFALFLLRLFGYDDGPHSVLRSQHDIWFPVCGSRVNAKTDGAVIERVGRQSYYVLLVQEDTSRYDTGGYPPEPQLVGQAIAAFHQNNRVRDLSGLPALDSQTFPAVIMFCTAPMFYFVTITKALLVAVRAGNYPQETTVVRTFSPRIGVSNRAADSMIKPLENRRELLRCFEAFKQSLPPAIEKISVVT